MENNVLIIGCGLAGLSAAVTAAGKGASVTVISPLVPERSQSVLASGGINAALNTKNEDDSWQQHCTDTMKAGHYLADAEAVKGLAENAPGLIRELAEAGVVFSRDANGDPDTRYFGGQKKSRTVFSKAGIGKQLVCGLAAEFRRCCAEGKARLVTDLKFVRAEFAGDVCVGIIAENTADGSLSFVPCDALIVASGGMSGLFGKTTGSVMSDGSVAASLFVSGVSMANLEMIQYHPTTIETSQKRMLISEAARGEGGRLFTMKDGRRWYFMEDWYGENGNLMPRDVVSRCIYKVCNEMNLGLGGTMTVGLDLTHLADEVVHDRLKEISDTAQMYLGIDPARDVIPVYPGVHYYMGGIYTDRFHRTSAGRLYAAGECACIYHGANRLGGNSTLGAIYGGRVAAETAVCDMNAGSRQPGAAVVREAADKAEIVIAELQDRCAAAADGEQPAAILQDLQEIMNQSMGIVRTGELLSHGLDRLADLAQRRPVCRERHVADAGAAENLRELGRAMIMSAQYRKESRGAHIRSDYPEEDDTNFRKTVVAQYSGGRIGLRTEETDAVFGQK